MRDIRQTPEYAKYLSKIGWTVERISETNYFIKKIPVFGNVIKIQRPEVLNHKEIEKLSRKYRPIQIIIEPKDTLNNEWLMAQGYKLSKSPYLSTKTLKLDLTKSEKVLFNELKKDCKAAVVKTADYQLSKAGHGYFRHIWKRTVGWQRYVSSLKELRALEKSFGRRNCLMIHYKASAGAIFLVADKIGYYWQAFTNREGRKSLAQYRLVWEGIFWAKRHNAKVFDFEGIYDERFPRKSWLGFTHFKKSFGGYEVKSPGCFVKTSLRNIIRG